jgi:O-antigen/teichoic acid export membrane protein
MWERLKNNVDFFLLKGEFGRGVVILAGGTAISHAIYSLSLLVLARLYTPEDFGLFATFSAAAAILSTISTLRYELAIPLPREDIHAAALVKLVQHTNAVFHVLLTALLMVLAPELALFLGIPNAVPWLYLLPVLSFASASIVICELWYNRMRQYKRMASIRILRALLVAVASAILAWMTTNGGLILGSVLAYAFVAASAAWSVRSNWKTLFAEADFSHQVYTARRYVRLPINVLPAHLMGTLAMQIPIFLFTKAFSAETTGFFSLAYRIVSLPTLFIANAIGDVYRQNCAELYTQTGRFDALFVKTLSKTATLALPFFFTMVVMAPLLFEVIFGQKWHIAGEYARILSVGAFFQFVFTPLDKGALVVGATRYIFAWHFLRLSSYLLLSTVVLHGLIGPTGALASLVGINATLYLIDGLMGWRFATGKNGPAASDLTATRSSDSTLHATSPKGADNERSEAK